MSCCQFKSQIIFEHFCSNTYFKFKIRNWYLKANLINHSLGLFRHFVIRYIIGKNVCWLRFQLNISFGRFTLFAVFFYCKTFFLLSFPHSKALVTHESFQQQMYKDVTIFWYFYSQISRYNMFFMSVPWFDIETGG